MSASASLDGGGPHHSRNSSASSNGGAGFAPLAPPPPHAGLVPPLVVPTPPMPPALLSHAGRFSPTDHVSPEITHSPNPLRQFLQPGPPPPPLAPPYFPPPPPQQQQLQPHQHQFLQQFMSTNGHQRSGNPLPSAPPAPVSLFQSFPPPRASGSQSSSTFQTSTLSSSFPVVRSVSSTIDTGRRTSNGSGAGSSTSSLGGSPRRGTRPGTRIAGEVVEYRPLSDQQLQQQSESSRSLEVMPITLYNSERTSQLGTLISVNEHFISYPIRNGLIRVISQGSVDRLLLRKHENYAVTELAFFSPKSDLLLSAGTDNEIAVWRVDTDPMHRELLKLVPTPAQRVKWHPFDTSKLAIVNCGTAFVTDLSSVTATGDGAENLHAISVVCSQSAAQLNDVAFSPSGEALLTAGADGLVHVYRISERPNNHRAEFVHRFEPCDSHAVNSLHFYSGSLGNQWGLLIGGDKNTRISLWNAPVSENVQPACFQTVKLLGASDDDVTTSDVIHETVFDPTTQFLFVADRTRPVIYVLHLSPSANARTPRRFDNITEFTLAYPVLSMGVLNRAQPSSQAARGGDGNDVEDALLNFSMQLYSLQTQAIQRYHVAATKCFLPLKPSARGSLEDDLPLNETSASFGQSVGALTTEGESVETSHQSAAESPRATTTASPETEVDAQENRDVDDDNDHDDDDGDDDGGDNDDVDEEESDDDSGNDRDDSVQEAAFHSSGVGSIGSPARSATGNGSGFRAPHVSSASNDDTASSIGGDDGPAFNLRSYARSSPSSSVRAFHDESSVQYEPSIDGTASESSQQTLLSMLRRMEASQMQRDEQLREQMRAMMGNLGSHLTAQVAVQVEKSIQKQLQTVLVPAMGRIVLHTMENNFMKPVQNGFQHVISEKLIPHMERKLSESLSTALPDQMSSGVQDMVERVVEDVRQPVRDSFRECFQDIIIPSFQAATQKMFEQINDTFVKGTRSAFENSGQSNSNAQVTRQLMQLIDVVDDLSRKVDRLTATNGSGSVAGAEDDMAVASEEEQQLEDQKSAVTALLAHEDYEGAFKLALSAQNVDLVTFSCQQCDVRAVLNSRPLKLSQLIILCLVQQLGADLADDLQTKLSWLRESLLVMDVRDASIAGFVSSVLLELKTGLNSVPDEARDSQFTLIYHILNSLLSSTA